MVEKIGGKKNKKKMKMKKNEDVGGLKNYVYWKKPKEKKVNPGTVFKEH
jgi:hypothetical protein